MSYCAKCGALLEDGKLKCSKCGAKTIKTSTEDYRRNFDKAIQEEPREKLLCELAYSGVLFWLPLLLGKEVKDAKYHANQGLWLLILACPLCWIIQIANIVRNFFESGLLAYIFKSIYVICFIAALPALLYLAIQALKCAFAIHKGETPKSILFFEERAIIK